MQFLSLPITTLTFKLLDRKCQIAQSTHLGEQLSQIILKSIHKCTSYNPDKSGHNKMVGKYGPSCRIHQVLTCILCLILDEISK